MKKDMLTRFKEMKQDAHEREIGVSPGQLCVLVLADVIEDAGIDIGIGLDEIDKSLIALVQNI